jgi:hypothetical protein
VSGQKRGLVHRPTPNEILIFWFISRRYIISIRPNWPNIHWFTYSPLEIFLFKIIENHLSARPVLQRNLLHYIAALSQLG